MPELRRRLDLFQTTMYGIGLILGAGIYVLIGEVAGLAGNAIWVSFILGGGISALTGLSYAEMASIYPKAAAEYTYVRNAFKSNFLAFIVGWLMIFTSIISATTVAMGFGGYLAELFGSSFLQVSAILLIVLLSFVNFYGIRESSWVNIVFTLIEVSGLLLIVYMGFSFAGDQPPNYLHAPFGIGGILAAIPLTVFAYYGFGNIANIAEETKNPTKVLPKAFMLAMSITAIIYVLVSLAALNVLPWQDLGTSNAPLADVAERALGPRAHLLLSAIGLFATTNTVLVSLVSGSRIIYGMAEQRSFPSRFAAVHSTKNTPWLSVLAIMGAAVMFLFIGDIATIANITVFTIVLIFAFVNASLIWLRLTEPDIHRPFRVPLSIARVPVLPSLGLITSLLGLSQFEFYPAMVGVGVICVGALFYVLTRRHSRVT